MGFNFDGILLIKILRVDNEVVPRSNDLDARCQISFDAYLLHGQIDI